MATPMIHKASKALARLATVPYDHPLLSTDLLSS